MSLLMEVAERMVEKEDAGSDTTARLLVERWNDAYFQKTKDGDIAPFTFSTNGNCWLISFEEAPVVDSENLDSVDRQDETTAETIARNVEKELTEMRSRLNAVID